MSTSVVYLIVGAVSAVFTIGAYGFALDGWRRATTLGRRFGLIVGFAGACSVAIGAAIGQEVIAVIAAPPGILLWSGLATRLASWLERRHSAERTP